MKTLWLEANAVQLGMEARAPYPNRYSIQIDTAVYRDRDGYRLM